MGDAVCEYRRRRSVLFRLVREGPLIRWHLRREGKSEPHCVGRFAVGSCNCKDKDQEMGVCCVALIVCQAL